MVDELDLPWSLPLLLPMLVLLVAGGRSSLALLGPSVALRTAVGPVVALSLWLGCVHVVAYASRSFFTGLVAGTLLASLMALVALLLARRLAPDLEEDPLPRGVVLGAILFGAVVFALGSLGTFFDELGNTQHMSISLQILQGHYPPRHLAFPEHELRYHYAFDLLVAAITALCRIPLWCAIDLATAVGAGLALVGVWQLGERIVGAGYGWLAALLVLFGGSTFFWIALPVLPWPNATLTEGTIPLGVQQNPPVLAYLFQHPWAIGAPLFFALALLVAVAHRARPLPLGVITFSLLLVTALAQAVVYVCVAGAMLVVVVVLLRSPTTRLAGAALLAADAVALLGAYHLGGFFAASSVPLPLSLHAGIGPSWPGTLLWNAASFALPLTLTLAGLGRWRGSAATLVLLLALLAGSVIALNVVSYGPTWDMVKFGTVATLALGLLAANGAARLLERRRPGMVALVTTSLVLTCVPSVAWAGTRAAICLAEGQPAPLPPAASDRSAMRWLAARSRPTDVVYRRAPAVAAYSYWAALPNTGIDVSVDGFPLAAEEIESLRQISVGPSEPEQLLRGGVRFLVVEPAREPDLVDRVEGWSAAGLTVEQTRFGELVVFEMLPRGRTRPETVP